MAPGWFLAALPRFRYLPHGVLPGSLVWKWPFPFRSSLLVFHCQIASFDSEVRFSQSSDGGFLTGCGDGINPISCTVRGGNGGGVSCYSGDDTGVPGIRGNEENLTVLWSSSMVENGDQSLFPVWCPAKVDNKLCSLFTISEEEQRSSGIDARFASLICLLVGFPPDYGGNTNA
ncbi:hypothetical protein DY000_02046124 [Brassica cretica]|uniref:Uncharacterized protein n=1 Tax=Brassica cretica TaxID=69181 RepID=A0ABQ7EU16_BRACR|nr:hypothetical protein DY000_02046124 [Brassica cretica]